MGSGGSEFIYVVLIKPDHMHQHRFWAEQSNGFSIIDGREAKFFVEVDLIGLNFSQVHSDAHVALAGMVAHLLVEFGGDPARGARSKPDMYAISDGSLPFAMHIENAEQAGFAVFNHTRMHRIRLCGIGTNIHNDTGEASPNTAFLHCLGDPIETVAMGKHRFKECGRPGLQHFSYTEACTHITIVLSEVALQDPDTITEPLDESHVVCATSNQGLAELIYMYLFVCTLLHFYIQMRRFVIAINGVPAAKV